MASGRCCSKQVAFGSLSPGGGEEQLLSARKKTDDAPRFDGHPHPHPVSIQSSSPFPGLVGTRALEGGAVTQA